MFLSAFTLQLFIRFFAKHIQKKKKINRYQNINVHVLQHIIGIKHGLLHVLSTLVPMKFSFDDLIKFNCSCLISSFNEYWEKHNFTDYGLSLQVYDNEYGNKIGKISQTYLYKEIVVKKLGLIKRHNPEIYIRNSKFWKEYVSDRLIWWLEPYSFDDHEFRGTIKQLDFKWLIEYFGEELMKKYILSDISSKKMQIISFRKLPDVNEFHIKLDITSHQTLFRYYESVGYKYSKRDAQQSFAMCKIKVDHDEKNKEEKCNQDEDKNKTRKETIKCECDVCKNGKCFHIIRCLMEFVPRNKICCTWFKNSRCDPWDCYPRYWWFGQEFEPDFIYSKSIENEA